MFTSNEWSKNKLSKAGNGREASKVVFVPWFWNHVVFTLKVMAPLYVLCLVDGERKTTIETRELQQGRLCFSVFPAKKAAF